MKETLNPLAIHPMALKPDDRLGYKIVAVIGEAGDWAAYKGLTSWSDEKVATDGDKLSKEAAEALFYAPPRAGLQYRI